MKNKIFWEKAVTKLLHRYFATDPAGEKMKQLSTLFSANAPKLMAVVASIILMSSAVIYEQSISIIAKVIAAVGTILAVILIAGSIMMHRRRRV